MSNVARQTGSTCDRFENDHLQLLSPQAKAGLVEYWKACDDGTLPALEAIWDAQFGHCCGAQYKKPLSGRR